MKPEGVPVLKVVHIYGSQHHLEQTVGAGGLRRTELVSHFIRGFNSCNGTMDFVDIGDERDLISWKIMGLPPYHW
jgi:hypothetical protein